MKIYFSIILSFVVFIVQAQWNNEWIDYGKTYYKIKVAKSGVYRINTTTLQQIGLQNVPAEHFQLIRNGQQISLFTSVNSGPLGVNDYIEFWGEPNRGELDTKLYRDPSHQLSSHLSLISDTAVYFLTVNSSNTNLRYSTINNDVSNNSLAATTYFIDSIRIDYNTQINRGFYARIGDVNLYSSSYDLGEFWSSRDIGSSTTPNNNQLDSLVQFFPTANLPIANVGNMVQFKIGIAGNASNTRVIEVKLNNTSIVNEQFDFLQAKNFLVSNLPASLLQANNKIAVYNKSATSTDRIVVNAVEMFYPRLFQANNQNIFSFQLPANNQGYYLEINNFNWGNTVPPILYDVTNRTRMVANVQQAGIIRLAIPPLSVASKFILVSQANGVAQNINTLTAKNFVNFQLTNNQGNFLIISNPLLYNSSSGVNPVQQYQQYRNSLSGGAYNAKVYDEGELSDQFAFGIAKHPLGIKNFMGYARSNFGTSIKHVLLLGKGVSYNDYRINQSSNYHAKLNLVPTWGWPASDNLLVSETYFPTTTISVGRISAVYGDEVLLYLDKVKQFEQQASTLPSTIQAQKWKKNIVHVVGANSDFLEGLLSGYLNNYTTIIKDTLFGASVTNFNRANTGPVSPITNALMEKEFKNGIALLTYFGHSGATALDYNLNDPNVYQNQGKYPFFLVNGCNAGNFFDFDTSRLSIVTSLAEKFVFAKDRGAIGYVANSHFGVTGYLDAFSSGFYHSLSKQGYGAAVTQNMNDGIKQILATYTAADYLGRIHAEEMLLHGDPALQIYNTAQPDYAIEESELIINPGIITVADASFQIKAFIHNLGKAVKDSVHIRLQQKYPDGTEIKLWDRKIAAVKNVDSILITVPIVAARDRGNHVITVSIDPNQQITELSKSNNIYAKTITIFEDELKPIYPYPYSIINQNQVQLIASTANPIDRARNYVMELDTTALFNSSFKITRNLTASGGVVSFTPSILFTDSTAYYWRVATVPSSGQPRWNTASFVYWNGNANGFNQSHLGQHLQSTAQRIQLNSNSRVWSFNPTLTNFLITHSIFPTSGTEENNFSIAVNGVVNIASACIGSSVIFNVFDPVSLKPLYNQTVPATSPSGNFGGFMNSAAYCNIPNRAFNFEFSVLDSVGRRRARDFMDWVPNGYLVTARLILDQPFESFPYVDVWKTDETKYGIGNSLYARLKTAGFNLIDSFNKPSTWVHVYKKNSVNFTPLSKISQGLYDRIFLNTDIASTDTIGTITSPLLGPAISWNEVDFHIQPSNIEDRVTLNVIGISPAGQEQTLQTTNLFRGKINISNISAQQYPFLKLQLVKADSIQYSAPQLKRWSVLYNPVPEGAIATNLLYNFKDTVEIGEQINFAAAFKNISTFPFADSIPWQLQITNQNNVTTTLVSGKIKALASNDTAHVKYIIPTQNYAGNNILKLTVNPLNLPKEQFTFNNQLFASLYVKPDKANPLLDVTFDGVKIMNGDIVSAAPFILMELRDESKFVALDDTALIQVKLKFPSGQIRSVRYDNDTLQFLPANLSGGDNVAKVQYRPALQQDGTYELLVEAKDKSGNTAGSNQYSIQFKVQNKPSISNLMNYPNPFTSSTAFVFTLTGTRIPQEFKIQILTVTGKIVKEITKAELGDIRIGKNITQYKWDGTDMFGQQLANGVYLYRVITSIDGKTLDQFNVTDANGRTINTDKYFRSGYGKMYLMR